MCDVGRHDLIDFTIDKLARFGDQVPDITTKVDKAAITVELKHHIRNSIQKATGTCLTFPNSMFRSLLFRDFILKGLLPGFDALGHLTETFCNPCQFGMAHFIETIIIIPLRHAVDSLSQNRKWESASRLSEQTRS